MVEESIKKAFVNKNVVDSSTCIDAEILAAFMDNKLTGKKKAHVEAHLASCDLCLDQVVIGKGSEKLELKIEPVKKQPDILLFFLKTTVEVVKNLGEELRLLSTPALLPTRGETETSGMSVLFTRDFETFKAEYEVEKLNTGKCEIRVMVTENQRPLKKVRVSIIRGEREVESHVTREGRVLFEEVELGNYDFCFSKGAVRLGELTVLIQ